MRKYTYKAVLFAAMFVCMSTATADNSYAGTINANEAELMGIIRGTFVYEGVSYVGNPDYINEAYYYFLRDDIEVTDSQKASAIKEMFSRIPEGISEGYLIPAGSTSAGIDKETSEASSELETEKSQDSNRNNTDVNKQTVPVYKEETAMVETQEASEIVSGDTVLYPAWSVKEKETTTAALEFEALPVKRLEDYEGLQNLVAESASSYDYEEEKMLEVSETLEQLSTGFFTAANWAAGVLGVGVLVSLGICLRMKLFHHKKEKRGKQKHV